MDEASMDAIIAASQPQANETPAADAPAIETEQAEITPTEEETTEEAVEPKAEATEEVPFPKKAVNAISRRDRKIGELKAREAHAAARIAELEARLATQQPQKLAANGVPLTLANGEPNPEAYTDWQQYQDDRADWRQAQKQAAQAPKQPEQAAEPQLSEQYQELIAERQEDLAEGIRTDAEALELFTKHQELVIPEHIGALFLEAEPADAVRAFKVLAKEGKLEALMSMPLAKAALEISRAQIVTPKPKTNAPKPLPASRGSVAGEKSLDQMSGAELVKWVRS